MKASDSNCSGFRVYGLGSKGFRVQGSGLRLQGLGFRVGVLFWIEGSSSFKASLSARNPLAHTGVSEN